MVENPDGHTLESEEQFEFGEELPISAEADSLPKYQGSDEDEEGELVLETDGDWNGEGFYEDPKALLVLGSVKLNQIFPVSLSFSSHFLPLLHPCRILVQFAFFEAERQHRYKNNQKEKEKVEQQIDLSPNLVDPHVQKDHQGWDHNERRHADEFISQYVQKLECLNFLKS